MTQALYGKSGRAKRRRTKWGEGVPLFSLMLSMVSEDSATKMKDKVEGGGYDDLELFAGGTLMLLIVSEDLPATKTKDKVESGGYDHLELLLVKP